MTAFLSHAIETLLHVATELVLGLNSALALTTIG